MSCRPPITRTWASHGLAGQAGCITQIREYPGPLFRYSVRGLGPADDDEISGLL